MTGPEAKLLRKRLALTQGAFWLRVGVTQSGGSRYESGRALPKPLLMLLAIAYGTKREREAVLKRLTVPAKPVTVRQSRWRCGGVFG